MSHRWSAEQALERYRPLSPYMWRALPWGFGLMTVVNGFQLVGGWGAYEHPWVAVALMAGLLGLLALVWIRSEHGLGPVLSGVVLVAAPAACLLIATQLDDRELVSPANWVSGFCVVPLLLLPFSRPLEEVVAGIAALIVTQAYVMVDAGQSVRDLHAIVMSGGAGAAIGVGTLLLVSLLQRIEEVRRELAQEARDAAWKRAAEVALRLRATEDELAAADLLDRIGRGQAALTDPETMKRAAELSRVLRRAEQGAQILLLAELLPADGTLLWTVDDEDNLTQRFRNEDRIVLLNGLRSVRDLVPEKVSVTVFAMPRGTKAQVVIYSDAAPLPETPEWLEVLRRFEVRPVHFDRWLYEWTVPLKPFFWEAR